MNDLLTADERSAALRMGWDVCWVYCLARATAIVLVLPTPQNAVKSAAALQQAVMLRAQAGDALAQKIMGLVLNPPPPRKKSK